MILFPEKHHSPELEKFLVSVHGEDHRALARDYIQSMFSHDYRRPTFMVYHKENKIIGAAAFSEELFTTHTWGISWVSVSEKHRNQGIGGILVKSCLQEIAKNIDKKATAILLTYPDKTKLYEKIGFKGKTEDHEGGLFLTMPILSERIKV